LRLLGTRAAHPQESRPIGGLQRVEKSPFLLKEFGLRETRQIGACPDLAQPHEIVEKIEEI
jgi:hypothetical protein